MKGLASPLFSSLSRPTATDINAATRKNAQSVTLSGLNKMVPVVYGEDRVTGAYLARVEKYLGNLVLAIGWSEGPCQGSQALYINEADLPGSGITLTHYLGTENQPVDPTLAAAIPGFADSYPGTAYTVFVIEPGTGIVGWPRVESVYRGKLVFNPITGETAWTQNAGLCMLDWITSTVYGPGMTVSGWDRVAAYCDTLYDGLKRCEFNLTITEFMTLREVLDLMSAYAECLWSFDGDSVLLVPDAPPMNPEVIKPWGVMEAGEPWGATYSPPDIILTPKDIIRGSLKLYTGSVSSAPTSVVTQYTPSSGDATPWVSAITRQAMVGVDEGDVQNSESVVEMRGLRRTIESFRKTAKRLVRLKFQGRYEWAAFAAGIKFQRGDVVGLPNMMGLKNQWVRILNVEMYGYGRHRITAEHYDEAMYADQINPVGANGVAPVGLIIPCNQATAPAGWALYTAANGKYIVGAGGEYAPGDTGGSDTCPGFSGNTEEGGAHSGGSGYVWIPKLGEGPGATRRESDEMVGGHPHTFTTPTITPNLYRRHTPLIIKTGSDSAILPSIAFMFGKDGIYGEGIQRVIEHNSRYLVAGAAVANNGAASAAVNVTTNVVDDSHEHLDDDVGGIAPGSVEVIGDAEGGGPHLHSGSVQLTRSVKTHPLAIYGSTTDFVIRPGFIGFWEDPESLPANWYACDGENGTKDLRDYFIQIAGNETVAPFGDNTLKIVGQFTSKVFHRHPETEFDLTGAHDYWATTHTDEGFHDHEVNASQPWQPPYHALLPIMYLPEIV